MEGGSELTTTSAQTDGSLSCSYLKGFTHFVPFFKYLPQSSISPDNAGTMFPLLLGVLTNRAVDARFTRLIFC